MSVFDARIIIVYAECNMNTRATARRTHYSYSGINYRLVITKRKTGLDPRNFFDLIKLYEMAQNIIKEATA